MDATTKAMGTMMEQFQQQAAEISQTAMQLGLTGVSNKYFIAAITAYQDEMKQCKWQVSGQGKSQINDSLKAMALGLGDKIMDLHRLQKEWKSEAQGQHRELLNALTALPPAPAPSTYGVTVGDTAGPYYKNQGQNVPAAFRPSPQQSGRLPGYVPGTAPASMDGADPGSAWCDPYAGRISHRSELRDEYLTGFAVRLLLDYI